MRLWTKALVRRRSRRRGGGIRTARWRRFTGRFGRGFSRLFRAGIGPV